MKKKSYQLKQIYGKLIEYLKLHPDRINTLSDQDLPEMMKVVKYYLRNKCKKDLYFLTKYILGYSDLTFAFHKPACLSIQHVNRFIAKRKEFNVIPKNVRNRLWLWFRGCFKTTIITMAHIIQLLLLDKNLRICIASNKLDNAKGMLTGIKAHFMVNPLFRFLFPEYCPVPNQQGKIEWGTSTSVTVPNRDDLRIKEGSIECAGVDTGLVSRHYDYIKKDDLVTDKSVTSEELIQATIDWDRLSLSLFDIPEKGFTDYVGTRYDERDLYGHLLKRDDSLIAKDSLSIFNKDGLPVFPERFTEEGIKEIRDNQGEYIFSCQYLLQPIPEKDRRFKEEWFETYNELPEYYSTCILVDPANSRKKHAKYTSIVVHAIGLDKKWYLVDGVFDKLSPSERIAAVFNMALKWKKTLRRVSYETIGFQETDKVFLDKTMREKGYYFSITPIESQEKSKRGRIEGLVPWYEHGRILFPETLPYYSKYTKRKIDIVDVIKYELLHFPQSEHLDFIDAQSQQLRFAYVHPVKATKNERKIIPGSFNYYRTKLKKYKDNPLNSQYSLEEAWDLITV